VVGMVSAGQSSSPPHQVAEIRRGPAKLVGDEGHRVPYLPT
jgi:hypothetical protein